MTTLQSKLSKPKCKSFAHESSPSIALPLMPSKLKSCSNHFKLQRPDFLIDHIDQQKKLKKKLLASSKAGDNLGQERQNILGWKSLFTKKFKKSIKKRNEQNHGCRPGQICLKKRSQCPQKNFFFSEPEPIINLITLQNQKHIPSEEFIKREQHTKDLVSLVLLNYDYLKNLKYSDRKIYQLIKFHCQDNIDMMNVFLRQVNTSLSSKSPQYQYESERLIILQKISIIISKKYGLSVEQFFFNLREFQKSMEQDVMQRGTEALKKINQSIIKKDKGVSALWAMTQRQLIEKVDHQGCFDSRIAKLEATNGNFERISSLNRKFYSIIEGEKLNRAKYCYSFRYQPKETQAVA